MDRGAAGALSVPAGSDRRQRGKQSAVRSGPAVQEMLLRNGEPERFRWKRNPITDWSRHAV